MVGAGHNGRVTATLLARAGLRVTVSEEKSVAGGATKTEDPVKVLPDWVLSTGAHLLGVMTPELIQSWIFRSDSFSEILITSFRRRTIGICYSAGIRIRC